METMDIAEFLANAERQDTEQLSDENRSANDAFLNQFKVADFGSWEELVPETHREQFQLNEEIKQAEELAPYRRRTAVQSYNEGMDDADKSGGRSSGQTKSKRTSKKASSTNDSHSLGSLSTKDMRNLVKSLMKFGYVVSQYDRLVADAGLVEKDTGAKPANAEGKADSRWVVLDYIDVMVHVMHEEMREFYGLEELWADAKEMEWSPANGSKGHGGERKSNFIH
jgi:hypothetical protein